MKNLFFVAVVFFMAVTVSAQTQEQLLGKWQLVKWTKKGKDKDIADYYKTDQVFQVFKEGNKFESIVGDKTHKGTWKLNKDNTVLTITSGIVVADFTVDYFDAQKRIITYATLGTLEYKKVSE